MLNEESNPDWEETVDGLLSVGHLEQLGETPAALQALLSSDDSLDREALAAAAATLGQQVASLCQRLDSVSQEYDLSDVRDIHSGRIKTTADELAAKYHDYADAVLSRDGALRLRGAVDRLDACGDLRDFARLLAPGRS